MKLAEMHLNDGTHGLPKNPRFIRDARMNHGRVSGVYAITNTEDCRIYIGSSVDVCERWRLHVLDLRRGKHHSRHLQNFADKYGLDTLEFCVLEYVTPETDPREREQKYIDLFVPEFNVCKLARSCLGIKRTAETKEKNRQAQIKRDLNGSRNPMYGTKGNKSPNWGKSHRPETIAKMIANHMPCSGKDNPNYGKKQSAAATKKANETRRQNTIKKHGKAVLVLNGEIVFEGATIPECASFIGVSQCSLRRAFYKGKLCKGYMIQKRP